MTVADQKPGKPASLHDFGAIGDGLPTSSGANSAALNGFGIWARAESAAGRSVHVLVPPGVYHFDYSLAEDCFKGIRTLVFSGPGATFLQTGPGGWPWPISGNALLYANKSNPLIHQAKRGDTRVIAQIPAELAQYAPGEMVMIAGLDIQYGGYPPNLYCFDFVAIRAIDHATGAMTFDPPLTHDYRPDFPAYPIQNNWNGSRIYKLDRGGFSWNVDHSFHGLEIRHQEERKGNYIQAMGRKVTFRDCVVPGFSESVCEEFLAERCIERSYTEPDKLVKTSVRRDGEMQSGFGLQSASVDLAVAENCKISLVGVGGKALRLVNCDIGTIGYGGQFGFCDSARFENCRIATADYCFPYMTNARYNFVDGVNVSYADGVFTILKNDLFSIETGGGFTNWNMIPGMTLEFCRGKAGDVSTAGSHPGGDAGAGVVVAVRDHSDSIAIATTLKAARVPGWASGQVFVKRRNVPVFANCTGNETIRIASDAERAGARFGDYFRYLFTAETITQGLMLYGRAGKLKRLRANIIKPMTGIKDARLTLGEMAAYRASTMDNPRLLQIEIDLTIAGKRDFTLRGLGGAVGTDRIVHDGLDQDRLPDDVWCDEGMPYFFCTGAPFLGNPAAAPVFELIFEFDVGMLAETSVMRPGAG
jgi:hypothetical protein